MDTGQLRIEFTQESDGRWLAHMPDLPGVMAYGATQDDASRKTKVIALQVLADMVEHNEELPEPIRLLFAA